MAGSSWPALVAGSKARASDVELKFDWIEGNIVPMSGGNTTDAAYDLGTTAARWKAGYFSAGIVVGDTATSAAFNFRVAAGGVIGDWQSANNRVRLIIDDTVSASFTGSTDTATFNVSRLGAGPLPWLRLAGQTGVEIAADANSVHATFDSNGLTLAAGASVNEFSTDGLLAGNSDDAVPTEQAVKTYVDNRLVSTATSFAATTGAFVLNPSYLIGTLSITADGAPYIISNSIVLLAAPTTGAYNFATQMFVAVDSATYTSMIPNSFCQYQQDKGATITGQAVTMANTFKYTPSTGAHTLYLMYLNSGAGTATAQVANLVVGR